MEKIEVKERLEEELDFEIKRLQKRLANLALIKDLPIEFIESVLVPIAVHCRKENSYHFAKGFDYLKIQAGRETNKGGILSSKEDKECVDKIQTKLFPFQSNWYKHDGDD